jgi:hypothetical protein
MSCIIPPSRNQPNSIRKISVAEDSYSKKELYKGLYSQENLRDCIKEKEIELLNRGEEIG